MIPCHKRLWKGSYWLIFMLPMMSELPPGSFCLAHQSINVNASDSLLILVALRCPGTLSDMFLLVIFVKNPNLDAMLPLNYFNLSLSQLSPSRQYLWILFTNFPFSTVSIISSQQQTNPLNMQYSFQLPPWSLKRKLPACFSIILFQNCLR